MPSAFSRHFDRCLIGGWNIRRIIRTQYQTKRSSDGRRCLLTLTICITTHYKHLNPSFLKRHLHTIPWAPLTTNTSHQMPPEQLATRKINELYRYATCCEFALRCTTLIAGISIFPIHSLDHAYALIVSCPYSITKQTLAPDYNPNVYLRHD